MTATYTVPGSQSASYTVTDPGDGDPLTCTCPDYRYRGARCKHIRRVLAEQAIISARAATAHLPTPTLADLYG